MNDLSNPAVQSILVTDWETAERGIEQLHRLQVLRLQGCLELLGAEQLRRSAAATDRQRNLPRFVSSVACVSLLRLLSREAPESLNSIQRLARLLRHAHADEACPGAWAQPEVRRGILATLLALLFDDELRPLTAHVTVRPPEARELDEEAGHWRRIDAAVQTRSRRHRGGDRSRSPRGPNRR